MCGFAGFSDYQEGLVGSPQHWLDLARRMARRIAHRGPDDQGAHLSGNCALAHARLAVIDPEHGRQPMSLPYGGQEVTIAYNGEIYNAPELRSQLESRGFSFQTDCDTEVLRSGLRPKAQRHLRLCCGRSCKSPHVPVPGPVWRQAAVLHPSKWEAGLWLGNQIPV